MNDTVNNIITRTVETYVSQIMERLDTSNMTDQQRKDKELEVMEKVVKSMFSREGVGHYIAFAREIFR